MFESDSLASSNSLKDDKSRTRTTLASLQRCSDWIEQHHDESNLICEQYSKREVTPVLMQTKYECADVSCDELSETSRISQKCKRRLPCSSVVPQDETEVDTSVASDETSHHSRRRKGLLARSLTLTLNCGWQECDFHSQNLDEYVSHVSLHLPNIAIKISGEGEDEENYVCLWKSCDFETPNADEVSRHVNFHSYHTKIKCLGSAMCDKLRLPDCNYGTDSVNLVPDLPSVLECCWEDCSQTYNNPNKFYSHVWKHALESQSTQSQVFRCLWRGCKAEARRKVRLCEHIRTHSKEKVVACPTCGNMFASRVKFIDHRKRQVTEEGNMYQCTHCSRFYPSERLLRDHMRHHVNRYKCQFCDMTCPSPYTLSSHVRHRHLDDKPFKCEYCNYMSKTQYNMKRHMSNHSSSSNFACFDCDYTCRSVFMLNWHYRKAHDSAPVYCCHMCDCRYARGASLTTHLMQKHNFHWPSGHSRFRFKRDEDGLFRLQTVRYESLDVVEDIYRGDGEQTSVLKTAGDFIVKTNEGPDNNIAAKVTIKEAHSEIDDYDVDDPDEVCQPGSYSLSEKANQVVTRGASMPLLDLDCSQAVKKKVIISIEEVDVLGNIIRSSTLEADEVVDVDEDAQIVVDGDCLLE